MQNAECRMQNAKRGYGLILHFAFCILHFVIFASCSTRRTETVTIEFWGLGREGEVVAQMVPEFERLNPGIRVDVQQIPWTAAHEKLLTAHVGRSLPDIAQMGNTWVPEFVTIGALEPLDAYPVRREDYFPGILETNVVDRKLYGVPWYVDTRVLFYRKDLLGEPPRTWSEWIAKLEELKKRSGRSDYYPLMMPTNEWAQPVALAVSNGAELVRSNATAAFTQPQFVEALDFYLSFYRRGVAQVTPSGQIANMYQAFGEGEYAMFFSGPWHVGELRRRLPAEMQSKWSTAPVPAPDGRPYPGLSLSGGSSLVLLRGSEKKQAAWKFIEFLSEPARQVRFYEESGDLPARRSAWNAPLLASDDKIAAFRTQLDHTVALPRVPEWEYIATTIFDYGELAARGRFTTRRAAELLDAKVNRILEKRRWVLEREAE